MANKCEKITINSPNFSKSRAIYLASGYEERVGEVFESRVTRLNAWKGARVQRMHVQARMGARLGVRDRGSSAREGARARGNTRGRVVGGQRRLYCSPESTFFTRNHLNDLK
ncbi:hypothetical protein CRG98_007797 [Punica granatum]|uniref:Uncharacterized protein n=1 Tax=Punica granatum TaxID=22663 RepID=A0A2I0KTJ5_PUNGR|nr:hypothetical protein CRG98_007797 [Punica granatum]